MKLSFGRQPGMRKTVCGRSKVSEAGKPSPRPVQRRMGQHSVWLECAASQQSSGYKAAEVGDKGPHDLLTVWELELHPEDNRLSLTGIKDSDVVSLAL